MSDKKVFDNSIKVKKAFLPVMTLIATAISGMKGKPGIQALHDLGCLIQDEAMPKSRGGGGGGKASTFHKDENGVTVAIRDWYLKLWVPLPLIEFTAKSTASGFNSMSKHSANHWSKQQRDFKKAKDALLQQVMSGDVQPQDLEQAIADLEVARDVIVPLPSGIGFDTLDELLAADMGELQTQFDDSIEDDTETPEEVEAEIPEVDADSIDSEEMPEDDDGTPQY